MTEEFETAGVYTGTWCLLPYSNEISSNTENFGWQNFDVLDTKEMFYGSESEKISNLSAAALVDINLDSTLRFMGLGLSPSPANSSTDWNQSIIHAEGDAEQKLDPKNFFEGLLELTRSFNDSPDEHLWTRTHPILASPVSNSKPEQLSTSLPIFDNLFLNESVVLSLFHDISSNLEDEPQACCNILTSKTTNEKPAEESEGNDDESPRSKRPRIETPSPLPSFKVRKEKLGDRITALQQLVSPFGKTDTASVLHEAIEYIKFLHEQVTVLTNPYMKSVASVQQQQISDKSRYQECRRQDLRSLGLCVMPISSTFPIAAQMNSSDFWTLPFGLTLK